MILLSRRFLAALPVILALVVPTASADDFYIIPVPVGESATIAIADVVDLRGGGSNSIIDVDESDDMRRVEADGDIDSSDFVVPADRVLVITGMQLTPSAAGDGFNVVFLQQRRGSSTDTRRQLIARTDATQSYSFAPGLLFPAGTEVRVSNRGNSAAGVRADIQGYLVDAN